jgi:hypothetical protein
MCEREYNLGGGAIRSVREQKKTLLDTTQLAAEIFSLEQRRINAMVKKDIATLDTLLAVVVRGIAQIRLENTPAYSVLFMDVWALRDGGWKIVAWQATRVPKN